MTTCCKKANLQKRQVTVPAKPEQKLQTFFIPYLQRFAPIKSLNKSISEHPGISATSVETIIFKLSKSAKETYPRLYKMDKNPD